MRYYISDLHFYHKNIISQMDKRPFSSLEKMHEYMISQWNRKVRNNDEVIILGDLGFMDGETANALLDRLHGKKYLIIGNHDRQFLEDKAFDRRKFIWIRDYAELRDNKRTVILSHYPIVCYNGQYRKTPEGEPKRYMLYGHVHNTHEEKLINDFINAARSTTVVRDDGSTQQVPSNMINTFCMFSDYQPLTLDEWIEVDSKRRAALNRLVEKDPGTEK